MSNGDERSQPPNLGMFGVLTAFVLCLIIVCVLAYGSGVDDARRDHTPASYNQAAKEDVKRACASLEPVAAFECIYEKVEASQEQARGEQDLTAQQRSAFAALASAVAAFLTLCVSVVGIWFVKRTLDATLVAVRDTGEATEAMRQANQIAQDASNRTEALGLAQMRAYISILGENATCTHEPDNSRHVIDIRGRYVNSGQSPARALEISCRGANAEKPAFGFGPCMTYHGDVMANSEEFAFETCFYVPDEMSWVFFGERGFCMIVVEVSVRYRDVFGIECEAAFVFDFSYSTDHPQPFKLRSNLSR